MSKTFAYIPTMHREFRPHVLKSIPVLCICREEAQPGDIVPEWAYSRREIDACAADLERLDAMQTKFAFPERKMSADEAGDLAGFARRERLPEIDAAEARARKILLLGYIQEERILAAREAASSFLDQASVLRKHFEGNLEEDENLPADMFQNFFPDGGIDMLPNWRIMLGAMLFALPEDSVLVTDDPRILKDRDLVFDEFPDTEEKERLPQGLAFRATTISAGTLVGSREIQSARRIRVVVADMGAKA
ncbi:MAG: hypothetical protein PUB69_06835 [Desulfovibrionaceae bacterium]|nr:hypothetical protein [Desulfovibrionaceae bacterium]